MTFTYESLPTSVVESSDSSGLGIVVFIVFILLCLYVANHDILKKLNAADGQWEAAHPKPCKEILFSTPSGWCLGKHKGKYACITAQSTPRILVTGGSGTGKSTTIIQSFLLDPSNRKICNSLVLDLKHELTDLCVTEERKKQTRSDDGDVIIFDPLDRATWGYDPFFQLNDDSSNQQIFECMQTIAISVIPNVKGDGAIWPQMAQKIFIGLLIFFYKHKKMHSLPEIINSILGAPVKDTLKEIISTSDPHSDEYKMCIDLYGAADETLYSVVINLSRAITVFATDQNLSFALGGNPRKFTPEDLLNSSVMLCIPEDKLQQYGQLIFMIFNQFFLWLMGLPEKKQAPNRKYMAVILDETVALLQGVGSNIQNLPQALRIGCRGKGCSMLICAQSISGLESVISKEECKDMISNCDYKFILDSNDVSTSKEFSDLCGTFKSKITNATGCGLQRKYSYTFSERPIVTPKEFQELPRKDEVIIVSNRYGYMRLKKCYVYKDRYYRNLLTTTHNS